MAIDTIKFTFVGKSPLMMHSERLVDVLDPEVRELKKLTTTKKNRSGNCLRPNDIVGRCRAR